MRTIAILAACAAVTVGTLPAVVHGQATGQTSQTGQTDAKTMWEKFKGSWNQTKGAVKEQWGKLTEDDLLEIEGRRDQLVGKIQTRYGITREEAEAQVGTWEQKRYRDM
jgi:uncharacterized protein YjbJ (UPF0337 family)